MRKLTCYEALDMAIRCIRAARAVRSRGLDVEAATLLMNATNMLTYAEGKGAGVSMYRSSSDRITNALDIEIEHVVRADIAAPITRAEA